MQAAKFSTKYISPVENPRFDWDGFKDAIGRYTGSDLHIESHAQRTIQRTFQDAGITSNVANLLHEQLSASIDLEKLKVIITSMFTNLQNKGLAILGPFFFARVSSMGNSSWEYSRFLSILVHRSTSAA